MENDFEVFYAPATETEKPRVIDAVHRNELGEVVGLYSNQSQKCLEARYNRNLAIEKSSIVIKIIEDSHCTEPSHITLEEWEDALEALPPQDWKRVNGVEYFKFLEHQYGDVTNIYCKTGKGCFVFKGRASMSGEDVAEKINNYNCQLTA